MCLQAFLVEEEYGIVRVPLDSSTMQRFQYFSFAYDKSLTRLGGQYAENCFVTFFTHRATQCVVVSQRSLKAFVSTLPRLSKIRPLGLLSLGCVLLS